MASGEAKKEEKKKEKTFKEVKQVVQTWVVGPEGDDKMGSEKLVEVGSKNTTDGNIRRRRVDESKD